MADPKGLLDQAYRSFDGQPDASQMPKILGTAEEAAKIIKEFKRVLWLDETQDMFNKKLDFTNPEVLLTVKKCMLDISLVTLENLGLQRLKPIFGLDKVPSIIVGLSAYRDCPEVMKAGAFLMHPTVRIPAPTVVEVGNTVPRLDLVTLAGKVIPLPDLHVNKDRPMMILASSAS